jgi:hypothetical protein
LDIQTSESASIPLPPMPARPAFVPERLLRRIAILEGILLLLLLAFAFLLASFPARNSDLFLRLATGRLIAGGDFTFGKDPFTFTAERAWVNHGWLFDLSAYLIYRAGEIGGTILVIVKALLVVLLAWLILQTASVPGQRRWVPAVLTLLAILAASPRFSLQPAVPSFVLMALTLFLLVRVGAGSPRIWFLPLVCLLWVNIDEWFFLGPVTIGLFLLGEWLEHLSNPSQASKRKVLSLVFLVSLAACLVNPYHIRAFTLPAALDPRLVGSAAAKEGLFRQIFLSLLDQDYYQYHTFFSAAGLAIIPLASLGILSFIAAFPPARETGAAVDGKGRGGFVTGWRWWRVLLWLAFFALSIWNVHTTPYFAIIAAPITALNFWDFTRRKMGESVLLDPGMRRWAISGRAFTIVIFILLGTIAVPGWLQAQPYYLRFVGWGVKVDRGLKDAAEQVVRWHREGRLKEDEHWFNTSPQALHYFAWFAADERGRPLTQGFIDTRLALYPDIAGEFESVRKSLIGPTPGKQEADADPFAWRKILAKHKVRFLVFYDSNMAFLMLTRLYDNPDEWEPRFAEGRSAVFRWHEHGKESLLERHARKRSTQEIDFEGLAFGSNAVQAPDDAGRAKEPRSWWEEYLFQEAPNSDAAGTARQHLIRFTALARRYAYASAIEWQAALESCVLGLASGRGGPVLNGTLGPLCLCLPAYRAPNMDLPERSQRMNQFSDMLQQSFMQSQDSGPVSSLYLAIRWARRAIHDNPEEIDPYLTLSEAYRLLYQGTRERLVANSRQMPLVEMIRRSQRAAALQAVLDLKPPPRIARAVNLQLVDVFSYTELNQYNQPNRPYFESYVRCLREAVRLSKLMEGAPAVSREALREQVELMEQRLKGEEQVLKSQLNSYEVTSVGKPLLQKVQIALVKGLSEKALELLRTATPEELTERTTRELTGYKVWVSLLLSLGHLNDARLLLTTMSTEGKVNRSAFGTLPIGLPAFGWVSVQLAAASGDYEEADKALAALVSDVEEQGQSEALHWPMQLDMIDARPTIPENQSPQSVFTALMVGDTLLRNAPYATGMAGHALSISPQMLFRIHKPFGFKPPAMWRVRQWPPENLFLAASAVGNGPAGVLPSLVSAGCAAGWATATPSGASAGQPIKELDIQEITAVQSVQLLNQVRETAANLEVMRAWLALEQGDIERAVQHTEKAVEKVALERTGDGGILFANFRARPLRGYCLYLITPGRR